MDPQYDQRTHKKYSATLNWAGTIGLPFRRFWQWVTKPHPAIQDVSSRHQAQLSAILALTVMIMNLIGAISTAMVQQGNGQTVFKLSSLALASLIAYYLSRARYFKLGTILLVSVLSSSGYWLFYANYQIVTLYTTIPLALLFGSALLSLRGMIVLFTCNLAAMMVLQVQLAKVPSSEFGTAFGNIFMLGTLFLVVIAFRNAIERDKLDELKKINQELVDLSNSLEQRVEARTHAILTSAEVSRRLSTILDLPLLVSEVVEQLQKAFNYYHVHIYLFDETRENLVMTGGTGPAGQAMLASGHHLHKGMGLVGLSAETNTPVIVPDVRQNTNWLPNALLPKTRSEAAIPISVGGNVLGVLDVQQDIKDGFKQDDASLLVAISNQVAVAIQNARLFSSVQQQAERESLIAAIGQKIRTSTSVDEVLQVALRELAQNLNVKRAGVEVHSIRHLPLTKLSEN